MDDEMRRVFGAFYGLLVGDSLGSRYEFKSSKMVKQMIHKDKVDGHLPMLGGGQFREHAGQVTDDSEMALSLAQSLVRCGGFNQADVASAYASWFATKPPDAGVATQCALSMPALLINDTELTERKKNDILKYCLSQTKEFNGRSLSNGMLMRISSLGIALRNAEETDLLKAAELDCQITHQNPIVVQATQLYVKLLVNLLKGQQPLEAIENAKKVVKSQLILDIIAASAQCPTPVRLENGEKITGDKECMGYFGVALQIALYELQHCESFEKSTTRVLEIGGDTDTNSCIAGVLLGAHLGVDAIPKDWIDTVLNAPVDRDYFFMEPLKNKTIDDFVYKLASSCCQLHEPSYTIWNYCSIL